MGIGNRLFCKFGTWMSNRPYVANVISTSILMASGDVIAQTVFSSEGEKYSLVRTMRMAFLGGCLVAPAVLTFYRVMERGLGKGKPLAKVIIDQGLFAPTMLSIFMLSLDLISGYTIPEIKEHYKQDYFSVLLANWTFWPAFQLINFALIPLEMRVLAVQIVALMWNTYLAWKLHTHKPQSEK